MIERPDSPFVGIPPQEVRQELPIQSEENQDVDWETLVDLDDDETLKKTPNFNWIDISMFWVAIATLVYFAFRLFHV